jgi:rhodanese-related sulfurtransferase
LGRRTQEPPALGTPSHVPATRFRRIDVEELRRRLATPDPPLVLDVRRRAAFEGYPSIPGAVPFALDRDPLQLPDVPRDRPIVAYCL